MTSAGQSAGAPGREPIRVCHICATTEGAAWLHEQLRDLRDRHGYDVTAILNGTKGGLVDRFNASGIRVLEADFDFISGGDLFSLPRKVLRLYRILKRERFDIAQSHLFNSMVIGRIAAWFADVPVRLSMVAGPFHLEAYTPRWIDRWTCWMETAIISSCTFMRTLYRGMGVPARKIELAFYGPDPKRFDIGVTPADIRGEQGWAPDAPVVGMVAYFYTELGVNRWTPPAVQGRAIKRQEDFIRAARMILDERPDVRFLLVGSGWEDGGHAYMARMRILATSLGLDPYLRFTGHRTDVPAVLRSLDVAVQASVNENLGGTIESLAMEAPTVATRVGGMVDTVIDGETGVLVEPADPADLKRGILRQLDDPDAARRMAKRGREYMLSRFTLDHTVDDLHGIYDRRLADAPRGYRPVVSALRFVGGSVVCAVIVLRFVFLDLFLLPRWDVGWRPWHRAIHALSRPIYVLRHRVWPMVANAVLRSYWTWRWRLARAANFVRYRMVVLPLFNLRHRVLPVILNATLRWYWQLRWAATRGMAHLRYRILAPARSAAAHSLLAARTRLARTAPKPTPRYRPVAPPPPPTPPKPVAVMHAPTATITSIPSPPAAAVVPITRIWLWRFYAFVGRHAPSGNRKRLREFANRLTRGFRR